MTSEGKKQEDVTAADLFECQMCGDCCKGFGGTVVTTADIKSIAAFIGADPERFVREYCRLSGDKKVLAQGEDGYCIFFCDRCTIHPVKPRMCRAWPFIRAILADMKNWHSMAASCPGMRTDVPDAVIRQCVADVLCKDS